jgi:hypothetical protein
MGTLGEFSQSPVVTTVGVIVWSQLCLVFFRVLASQNVRGAAPIKELNIPWLHNQRCAAFAARAAQRQGGPGEAMSHSDKDVADGGSAGKGSEDEPDDETARPT